MGRRILTVLVAILFVAGAFAVPAALAAKGDSGQTLTKEQQGQKHKTKKSAKKSSKLSKNKSKATHPGSKQKAKNKKHASQQA